MSHADWESRCISLLRQRAGGASGIVRRGIGDDAALLQPPPGEALAVSVDTIVQGRHFPKLWRHGADIGHLALAVNLSDMAATAATPRAAFLALTMPAADEEWLQGFASGFFALAERHNVALAGGDVTCGPLAASVTICGSVPEPQALARGGARPGDLVYVSGSLGGAALGHACLDGAAPAGLDDAKADSCIRRLLRPEPRVSEGLSLRGVASACTDLSDGMARNLSMLLEASGCGADISLPLLPLDDAVAGLAPPQCWDMALSFGGDYELCCTVPPDKAGLLKQGSFTRIGQVSAAKGLRFAKEDGSLYQAAPGYSHFQR